MNSVVEMTPAVRVMLVDDDEDDFLITRELLSTVEKTRYELDWRDSFSSGLESMRECEHDVYLVDYRLGEENGLELLRRAREAGCEGPIIILTGQGDREIDLEAMRAGAADYLIKGKLDANTLERSIRYALERHGILEALRESEERYALSARGANDGLWVWDVAEGSIYFSPRWKAMLGYEEEEIGDRPEEWFSRVHPEDLTQLRRDIEHHQRGETEHLENEHRVITRNEEVRWMLCRGLAVRDDSGQPVRIAGSQTDITHRKNAEAQLLHDAFHDRLTGLPNRALFMDRLHHAMQRRSDGKDLFCVLFLDLDRFKIVNDSLGHSVGDQLLVEVSRRLGSVIREEDTLARLGGDEFAILLENLETINAAIRTTRRVQEALSKPFDVGGNQVYATASIGIASSSGKYERAEEILRDSDIAMYRAKSGGRSRHEVFDRTMHARALHMLQLETDLRRAVENAEFELHYQPIIELATGRVASVEALLRWNDGERVRSAWELIPLAEETGLIHEIGEWVLETGAERLREWRETGVSSPNLRLSVNLSPRQFHRPNLPERLCRAVDRVGIDREAITFEITESAVMDDAELASRIVGELRDAGFRLGLDDFGTGFSSLSMLHNYPFQILKVDQSFVRAATNLERRLQIVRTIATLGKTLGMEVVVEGVEERSQLDLIRELDVQHAQGFLFSRPVDASAMTTLLARDLRGEEWSFAAETR